MGKKKGKNSNYSGPTGASPVPTKKSATATKSPDEKKNIILLAIGAVLVVGIIVAIVLATIPKVSYVEMDFGEYGSIVIEVDEREAPITADNFLKLVNDGFYDGLTIFRAQAGFVIQGGEDNTANLKPIKGEFSENGVKNDISHNRGVISMARTNDPDSATSQFFITLHDSAKTSLDGKYAGFGRVVEGMDVVDAIAAELMKHPSNYMGFVEDEYAIEIVSARVIDYEAK